MIKKFFQVELDLRALGALRIALGLLVIADLILRSRDLSSFYTDTGVLPRLTLLQMPHPTLFNFFNTVGTTVGVSILFALLGLAALGLTLGWQTRTCTLVVWVLHMALKHRNPLILHAGDLELGLVLFWSLFLPMSARYSLDAKANPEWAKLPNLFSSVATTGYVLQLSLMYLMAALNKSDPVWTESGAALYYCFSFDQFATGLARYLTQYPDLLKTLTFVALGLEYCIPLLLWIPWRKQRFRWAACVVILFFHLGIAATLNLGLMVPINILATVGLWPGGLFDRLARKVPGLRTQKPGYRGPCPGFKLSTGGSVLLVLVCFYICHLNYAVYNSVIVPKPIKYFGYIFRQQQTWSLFAPHPGVRDGWFVVEGTRLDDVVVDLVGRGEKSGFQKPASVAASFQNQRWRLWWLNLLNRNDSSVNESFATYLARRWNDEHRGLERVKKIRLLFVSEPTPPPGQTTTVTPVVHYEFKCPEELYRRVDEVVIP